MFYSVVARLHMFETGLYIVMLSLYKADLPAVKRDKHSKIVYLIKLSDGTW